MSWRPVLFVIAGVIFVLWAGITSATALLVAVLAGFVAGVSGKERAGV